MALLGVEMSMQKTKNDLREVWKKIPIKFKVLCVRSRSPCWGRWSREVAALGCVECEEAQSENAEYYFRWKNANIRLSGCAKHITEVMENLRRASAGR